jgi:hypothetical protein
MKRIVPIFLICLLSAAAWSKVEAPDDESAITPEPKVTIVHDRDRDLHIHEINGRIYGIKVIPQQGEPYFLVDEQGDGNFVRNPTDRMWVPRWVLISW